MNWNVLKQNGVKFGITRSSYGTSVNSTSVDEFGIDKKMLDNAREMTSLSMPWAIYHYVVGAHSISGQFDRIILALQTLQQNGTPPVSATFSDGATFPSVFLDVEETNITPSQIKTLVDALQAAGITVGIYTRKNAWDTIFAGITPWWSGLVLWIAAYGANDGTTPNFIPQLPIGWQRAYIWQYTSLGGNSVGHVSNNLDVNIACAHLYPIKQPPVPPPANQIDILSYLRGPHGFQYEMRRPDGGQERYQIQWDTANPNVWYIVKGENQGHYERWSFDDNYIYLEMDTSPSNATDGTERYYTVTKNGTRSPKYKRMMSVGEVFGDGGHVVQFYNKLNCQPHAENSGNAANTTTFIQGPYSDTFYNGITSNDVIKILENTEYQYWVRGIGRVRWESAWGDAQISEIHGIGSRPDVQREFIPCLTN